MTTIHNHILGAALVAALALTTTAQAFEWSDNFIGYRYGTDYREPVNPKDIAKNIVQFQHVSGYKYGTNFLNVDMLASDSSDPAAGGAGGAQEFYMVYRHTLSLSKATGEKFEFGPIKDVGFVTGFDLNSKNDAFGPRVQEFYVGASVDFKVPGFFSLALLADKENNRNGFVSKKVKFDTTYCISAAWGIPFKLGMPVVFKGFSNFIGSKGKDGFGNDTKSEWLTEAALMFDVGSLAGKKDTFYAGVGYQYWRNKFGNNSSADTTGGSTASVPQLQLEIHF